MPQVTSLCSELSTAPTSLKINVKVHSTIHEALHKLLSLPPLTSLAGLR